MSLITFICLIEVGFRLENNFKSTMLTITLHWN